MKTSGTGSLTTLGMLLAQKCAVEGVELEFSQFVVSNYSPTLAQLTSGAYLTKTPLDSLLATIATASKYQYTGNVLYGGTVFTPSGTDYTIAPVLCKLIANAIPIDVDMYSLFICIKDFTGNKIGVSTTVGISVGNTLYGDGSETEAEVIYVDAVNNFVYVTDRNDGSGNLQDFILGESVNIGGANLATIASLAENDVVLYKGCLAVDERLTLDVVDASAFLIGGYVSGVGGASALITHKAGNTLTVNRLSTTQFVNGEALDNAITYSATEITLTTQSVDTTNSSLLPITYISDGADILLKVNLRLSTGFPVNLKFVSTILIELEQHNADENDSHVDVRMTEIVNTSINRKDIRDVRDDLAGLKNQIRAMMTANGLSGTII